MAKKKKSIYFRIFGIFILILGLFYLLLPHTVHQTLYLDFGLEHYHHIALGGLLIVLGALFSLNGKKLITGIYPATLKKNPNFGIILFIISFFILYLYFNSMFELFAGDVSDFKILLARISSISLTIMILVGMINGKKIFGIKSTRY